MAQRAAGLRNGWPGAERPLLLAKDQLAKGSLTRGVAMALSLIALKPRAAVLFDVGVSSLLSSLALKTCTRSRLILDIGDPYRELHRRAGHSSGLRLELRGLVEWLSLNLADVITARGQGLVDDLRARGYNAVSFIPDGVDVDRTLSIDGGGLRARLGFDGVLSLCTLGSLLIDERYRVTYGWDLVEALALLADQPVRALIIGDGAGRVWLERRARELGVYKRIVFTGNLAFDDVVRHLKSVDICLSTQSDDLVGRTRTTGKLPLYMALGKFVLASKLGEAERVLPEQMLIPFQGELDRAYPARLARRVRYILAKPEQLALGKSLPVRARERYDYPQLARRMSAIVEA